MAIIRWNPWNISSLLEDDFDLPTSFSRVLGQGLNLYETEDAVVAEAAMPGVPEERIDITLDDSVVRITGSSEETTEQTGQRKYFMSSMARSYNYSFRLPQGVLEGEEPSAELRDGILTLTFKKAQKAAPKKVKVVSKAKK